MFSSLMTQQQSKNKKKDKDKPTDVCSFPRQSSATGVDSQQQQQGIFSSFLKSLSRSMPPVFGTSHKNKDTSILKDKSKSTCEGINIGGGGGHNNSNSSDKETEQQEMLFQFIKPKEQGNHLENQISRQQQKNTTQQKQNPDKSPNNMDQILLSRNDVSSNGMLTVEEDNHEGSSNDNEIIRNRLNDINHLQCVTPHDQSVLNIETMSSEEWDTENDQDDQGIQESNEVRKIIDKTFECSSTSNLKMDLKLNKPCVFVTKIGQNKQMIQDNKSNENINGRNKGDKEQEINIIEFGQNNDDKCNINKLEKLTGKCVSYQTTFRNDKLNGNQRDNIQSSRMSDNSSGIVSVSSFIVQNSRTVQESQVLQSQQIEQQPFNINVRIIEQQEKVGYSKVIVGTDCETTVLPEISCILYRSMCPKEKQRIIKDVIQANGKLILKDDSKLNTARELLRYKSLEDCSNLLLDALLQRYSMWRHNQMFQVNPQQLQQQQLTQDVYKIDEEQLQMFQKNDHSNLFILKRINDPNDQDNINKTTISFKAISEYLSSGSYQHSELMGQEIVKSLLSATISAYQIFVSAGITLPVLSSTSIAISLPEKRIYFTQLESCTRIVGLTTTTSSAISEKIFRKQERQKLIAAIKSITVDFFKVSNSSAAQSEANFQVFEKIMDDFIETGEVQEINFVLHGTLSEIVLDLSKKSIEFKETTRLASLNGNCSSSYEERSNFGKCRKLQTLSAVYSSLMNPDEETKCLEQLRQLQSSCYGEDSVECLKTIVQLARAYSRRTQSNNGVQQSNYISKLLSLLEPATAYLRQQLLINPQSASDLYAMLKQKIKFTNSPTTILDFNALIDEIQKQKKSMNKNGTQGQQQPQQQQIISPCSLALNVPKLYYTFGCYLYDSQDIAASLQQFKNAISAILSAQNSISSTSTQQQTQIQTGIFTTSQLKLSFYAQSHLARSLFRLGRKSESVGILKQLSELQLKFACPVFFQFSGIFQYEMNQYLKAHTLLHQAYVLIQSKLSRKSHNNIDFLDLLLYYCLATLKTKGAKNSDFQRLVREMKNLTGDYHNIDCLLELSNVLCEFNLKELAMEKFQQAKSILKLLGITSKQETQEFKLYKKKETSMQEKINKIGSSR